MVSEIDKNYILLNEIDTHKNSSQRDLSFRTGLSLGTVNLLLQKMIRDGLVKMESIPAKRVIYMLTPQGLAEKTVKTVNYIRKHYQIIEETKTMIYSQLVFYHSQYNQIILCLPGNELDDLLTGVIDEYRADYPDRHLLIIEDLDKMHTSPDLGKQTILLYLPGDEQTSNANVACLPPIAHASLLDMLMT